MINQEYKRFVINNMKYILQNSSIEMMSMLL